MEDSVVLGHEAPTVSATSDAYRKRFQNLLTPQAPVVVLDEEGTIRHLTPSARRLLEYKPNQRVDPRFFSLVHGNNLYQVMRDVADMVCYGRTKASWMLRMRTGMNRWRWYKTSVRNELTSAPGAILITLREV